MRRYYIILVFLITCLPSICAKEQTSTEHLLIQLDSIIANRDEYLKFKIARLSELQQELINSTSDDREKFDALGRLYSEYHSFNEDSAYVMSQRQLSLARKIGNNNLIMNAMLNNVSSTKIK